MACTLKSATHAYACDQLKHVHLFETAVTMLRVSLQQVLPSNASLINLMLGGPVPEHILSFIGAVLSSNAAARGSAASPQRQPMPLQEVPQPPPPQQQQQQQQTAGRLSPPQRPSSGSAHAGALASSARSPGASSGGKRSPLALGRSLTVQARAAGAQDLGGLAGLAAGGGADQAAEVFRRHDADCSGYLDAQEMMSALNDLGLLEGLTARQLGECVYWGRAGQGRTGQGRAGGTGGWGRSGLGWGLEVRCC